MRLVFFIPNLSGGGAEKAVLNVSCMLNDNGHEVTLLLLEPVFSYQPRSDLRVESLFENRAPRGFLGKRLAVSLLRRWLKRNFTNDDRIFISSLPLCDEITHLAKVDNVWFRIASNLSAECSELSKTSPRRSKRRFARYREIYENQRVIAVSDGLLDSLRKSFSVANDSRRIYNPFNLEEIRTRATAIFKPLSYSYLIYVGRDAPAKRLDVLLEAISKLKEPTRLVMLTDHSNHLDVLIKKFNLTDYVKVLGFQINPYVWIRNAKCLILCSDYEGLPNVLVEAIACGVPVISTDCPFGPREILQVGLEEFLTRTGSADSLANSISRLINGDLKFTPPSLHQFSSERSLENWEKLICDSNQDRHD